MSFNIYEVVRAACQSRLGTFRSNDATATGTSLHVLSVLSAIIPTYLLCQMHGNSPEFEFQVTIFESRKRNIISSLPVYVLHKTRNKVFSRRSRAKTAKKWTKKRDARTKCLFCLLRWCYTRRFATAIFRATQRCNIVATLFRIVTALFQHCNALLR